MPILAASLVGGRFVAGNGLLIDISEPARPVLLDAIRVSLGALGIFTELRLKLVTAFELRRREWCAPTESLLEALDDLVRTNRNMDFYWYPRRDEVKIRTLNPPQSPAIDLPFGRLLKDETGQSHQIVPRKRELRFEEMEYFVPAEMGPACFREVRNRIISRHRKSVAWRVLYRTIAADNTMLSPASGRESVTISLHQNASLPYWPYFGDVEPILRSYGGRPQWGKKHSLTAAELRPLYPRWDEFHEIRQELDPDEVLLSPSLRTLFEERKHREAEK